MKKRIFTMFLTALLCMTGGEMVCQAKRPLSSYSTQSYNWGLGQNLNHKKPNGTGPAGWKCKKDHAYYTVKCSKKNKVVYLSFDCGYEAGYTKKILKTLKKHHAKAIFFVTKDYIMSSPGLVKKMKKEGHLVGNHTTHHPRMAKLSVKRIQREIKECEKAMKKKTGFKMDPFIRPPEGNFSMRSVKVAKAMGYSTIFWSLAYYDYDTANQPGKNFVIRKFKTYYHNGMIPLIHACSKSNTEALGEVLTFLKKKGFRFGTLDEFAKNS